MAGRKVGPHLTVVNGAIELCPVIRTTHCRKPRNWRRPHVAVRRRLSKCSAPQPRAVPALVAPVAVASLHQERRTVRSAVRAVARAAPAADALRRLSLTLPCADMPGPVVLLAPSPGRDPDASWRVWPSPPTMSRASRRRPTPPRATAPCPRRASPSARLPTPPRRGAQLAVPPPSGRACRAGPTTRAAVSPPGERVRCTSARAVLSGRLAFASRAP